MIAAVVTDRRSDQQSLVTVTPQGKVRRRVTLGSTEVRPPVLAPNGDIWILGAVDGGSSAVDRGLPRWRALLEVVSDKGQHSVFVLPDREQSTTDDYLLSKALAMDTDENLYFGWGDAIISMSPSGAVRWVVGPQELGVTGPPDGHWGALGKPAIVDQRLYVFGNGGEIVILSLDGHVVRVSRVEDEEPGILNAGVNLAGSEQGVVYSRFDYDVRILDRDGNLIRALGQLLDHDVSPVFFGQSAVLLVRGVVYRVEPDGVPEFIANVHVSTGATEGPFVAGGGMAVFMHGGNDPRVSLVDLAATPPVTSVIDLDIATGAAPVMPADGELVYAVGWRLIAIEMPITAPGPLTWSTPNANFRNTRCISTGN
ncbi:MAG: hypothetical protein U1F43_08820 [Myxococcota bacterium]